MPLMVDIAFILNGRAVKASVLASEPALTTLRERFDLAAAKLACGEGECGACTIIVDGASLNSCLMPAVDLDGREVVSVEGLWTEDGADPVQQAFIDLGAVQCGFCTPGMIAQAHYLVSKNPALSEDDIRRGLEGNICRCTGYTKIIDAVASAAHAGKA
ncbi:MAG: (2Fe-2S)-binding protein [Alphaproteobacteria bacterium]|nr:(2Fe-2S)-binding protein [Alphaproteobacteria bacterium]